MNHDERDLSDSPVPPSPPISRLPEGGATPFRDLIRTGWRAALAVWFSAALLFVIYAPQPIGAAAVAMIVAGEEFRDFQANPTGAPPWQLIALSVYGLGNCVWIPFVLFGLPWIKGAAAARIRELIATPERRNTSFVDAGNRVYGRVLVLTIILWLMIGACAAPSFLATYLVSDGQMYDPQDPTGLSEMTTHPAILGAGFFAAVAGTAIVVVWHLCVAAVVVEDQGLIGAIQRGVGFITDRRSDAWKLFLFAAAFALPVWLMQQSGLLFGFNWFFVVTTALSVVWQICADFVVMGVAIALYLDRRKSDVMPTLEPLQR